MFILTVSTRTGRLVAEQTCVISNKAQKSFHRTSNCPSLFKFSFRLGLGILGYWISDWGYI